MQVNFHFHTSTQESLWLPRQSCSTFTCHLPQKHGVVLTFTSLHLCFITRQSYFQFLLTCSKPLLRIISRIKVCYHPYLLDFRGKNISKPTIKLSKKAQVGVVVLAFYLSYVGGWGRGITLAKEFKTSLGSRIMHVCTCTHTHTSTCTHKCPSPTHISLKVVPLVCKWKKQWRDEDIQHL